MNKVKTNLSFGKRLKSMVYYLYQDEQENLLYPKEHAMNDAFEKNMQIIAGANLQNEQEKQLSAADKKKLSDNYFKLFFNLSYTNWLRGRSLGEAWYIAIKQMQQFIENKNGNNQASLYLRQIFASHKAKWSQVMMTSQHRDDILELTPEQKQNWNQRVAQNTTSALNILNDIIKTYSKPSSDNNKQAQTQQSDLKMAVQKMQTLIMLQLKNKQNGTAA